MISITSLREKSPPAVSRHRAWLATALVGAAALGACRPLCDGKDDSCIELRIEASGRFSELRATLGYAVDTEPLQSRIDFTAFDIGAAPLARRVDRPPELLPERFRELSVRLTDRKSGLQSAGSVLLSAPLPPSVTVPLPFSFLRRDVPMQAGPVRVGVANLDGSGPPEVLALLEQSSSLEVVSLSADGNSVVGTTQRTMPPAARWLAVGDLNRDGLDDVMVTSLLSAYDPRVAATFSSDVIAFFGQSDGSLLRDAPTLRLPSQANPGTPRGWQHIELADVDHDGQLDVVTSSTIPGTACAPSLLAERTRIAIARLDPIAPGSFPTVFTQKGSAAQELVLCLPSAAHLQVRDLNQDLFPEIVIVHSGSATSFVNVIANNISTSGTFAMPTGNGLNILNEPFAAAAGDFDSDGGIDLAVVAAQSSDLHILRNTTSAAGAPSTFQLASAPERRFGIVRYGPSFVVSADFDGDGRLDLATADYNEPTVSLLRGTGDGHFELPVILAVGHAPTSLATADLDLDGRPDLVISNFSSPFVTLLYNRTTSP